jgi:hypothetical protein
VDMELGDMVPVVKGKAGSVIRGIEEKTGARLKVAKGETVCTISGPAGSVAAAQALVAAILEGGSGRIEDQVRRAKRRGGSERGLWL